MKSLTLRLWLVFCVSLAVLGVAYATGFAQELWQKDRSHLSSAILILYFLNSAQAIRIARSMRVDYDAGWKLYTVDHAAKMFFAFGILGNAVAAWYMLKGFGTIGASEAATQAVRADAMAGLSIGFLVNGTGVACWIALEYQLSLIKTVIARAMIQQRKLEEASSAQLELNHGAR